MPNDTATNLGQTIAELRRELEATTAERNEALAREDAMAEVLQVVNSSPGDLAPVFDAILEKAQTLCDASFGQLVTFDGVGFSAAAWRGYEPGPSATIPTPGMALYRIVHGEQVVHVPDITADDVYRSGNAVRRRLADEYGARTAIGVVLKKDSAPLGAFVIYRTEIRPFTDKQIALLQNFSARAVIAIEIARLLTETREALEQQTATAEVLQIIKSSSGNLLPVYDAILEKARSLCSVAVGGLTLYDGQQRRAVTVHGLPEQFVEEALCPFRPGPAHERLIRGERLVHISDFMAVASESTHSATRALPEMGVRTTLLVPLRKDGTFLATSPQTGSRCGHSPTRRSRCSKVSLRRRSSRWTMPGSWTRSASVRPSCASLSITWATVW